MLLVFKIDNKALLWCPYISDGGKTKKEEKRTQLDYSRQIQRRAGRRQRSSVLMSRAREKYSNTRELLSRFRLKRDSHEKCSVIGTRDRFAGVSFFSCLFAFAFNFLVGAECYPFACQCRRESDNKPHGILHNDSDWSGYHKFLFSIYWLSINWG